MCAALPSQSCCGCSPVPQLFQGRGRHSPFTHAQSFSTRSLVLDPPDNGMRLLILPLLSTNNCPPLILQHEAFCPESSPMNLSGIFHFLRQLVSIMNRHKTARADPALPRCRYWFLRALRRGYSLCQASCQTHTVHYRNSPSPSPRQAVHCTGCTADLPTQCAWGALPSLPPRGYSTPKSLLFRPSLFSGPLRVGFLRVSGSLLSPDRRTSPSASSCCSCASSGSPPTLVGPDLPSSLALYSALIAECRLLFSPIAAAFQPAAVVHDAPSRALWTA